MRLLCKSFPSFFFKNTPSPIEKLFISPGTAEKRKKDEKSKRKKKKGKERADVIKRGNENQEKKRGKVKNGRDDVALE